MGNSIFKPILKQSSFIYSCFLHHSLNTDAWDTPFLNSREDRVDTNICYRFKRCGDVRGEENISFTLKDMVENFALTNGTNQGIFFDHNKCKIDQITGEKICENESCFSQQFW